MLSNMYDVFLKPVVTEKSTLLAEHGKIVLKVKTSSTKVEIKEAFEKLYQAKVRSVNIINCKGKKKIFKGRRGVRSDFKKAILTLEDVNKKIDFTSGV